MEKFKAHILVVDDDDGIWNLVYQFLNENNSLLFNNNDDSLKNLFQNLNIDEKKLNNFSSDIIISEKINL